MSVDITRYVVQMQMAKISICKGHPTSKIQAKGSAFVVVVDVNGEREVTVRGRGIVIHKYDILCTIRLF